MGMYTEIFVNCDLKTETPQEVIDVLRAICGSDLSSPVLEGLPDRWALLFGNGSFSVPLTCCGSVTFSDIAGHWSLIGKGDIKNYNDEIENFFKWLMPWIDAEEGAFIGYWRYEEDLMPTLVVKEPTR